jgi:periplasmic divalent cation tolerance protein
MFRWKGKVEHAKEILLVIKASSAGFERLRQVVVALHPYEVPEVIGLPMSSGHLPYLQWLLESTAGRASSA